MVTPLERAKQFVNDMFFRKQICLNLRHGLI